MGIGLSEMGFLFSIFSRQWTGVGREDGGWGWVWMKPIEFGSDTKLMQALRLGFAWKSDKAQYEVSAETSHEDAPQKG